MSGLQALLWDVDGTLAETERDGHRVAFNLAFESMGLSWYWDEARYGELLRVTGGRERLLHDLHSHSDAPTSDRERKLLTDTLHARKNRFYAQLVHDPGISLRAGVENLMQECREHGVPMAITTTTSRENVEALLGAHFGSSWQQWFAAVICGEQVVHKKPDPEVYARTLQTLAIAADQAVAIEDSPAGVSAAAALGIPVIATRSFFFSGECFEDALACGPGLHTRKGWSPPVADDTDIHSITLGDVLAWHTQAVA